METTNEGVGPSRAVGPEGPPDALPGISGRMRFTRLDFLKTSGMVAGGLAIPSALSTVAGGRAGASPGRSKALRVAAIFPDSSTYPALGNSLTSGLALGFGGTGAPKVRLVRKPAGSGEESASRVVDGLLDAGVDLAVGFVSPQLAAILDKKFEERDRAFVAVDAGANVPRWGDAGPAFLGSLSMWRAERAFGEWAAGNVGRRAMLAASFHDSGYDAPYAFRVGFEAAGGEVLDTRVTHVPGDGLDGNGLDSLMQDVGAARPDFVYAAYCGDPADEFLRAYVESGLSGRVPLLGSGFITGGSRSRRQGAAAARVRTCSSWASGLRDRVNRRFASAYREKTGGLPDEISVLGYETARMVSASLLAAEGNPSRTGRFGRALADASVAGPRGRVAMNAGALGPAGDLYIREARRSGGAKLRPSIAPNDQLAALRGGVKTGWLHPYLGS